MSSLFTPLSFKKTTLKNRMVLSPMCMYSSEDGFASNFHLVHMGSRALGGFSLLLHEASAISPEGRITAGDLGIWKDDHIPKLKEIAQFCHQQGALIGTQLAHAGRKASHRPPHEGRKAVAPNAKNGWQTFSASALSYDDDDYPPKALDKDGIEKVKKDFVSATKRAKEIGYDVVEIHAAHGYLLHQFYSPLSNNRTDQYGGSFENRIRLLLEITALVKEEWGDEKPLFVRISATDWTEDGWTIEESIALAKQLKQLGVDAIDVSTGGNIKTFIPTEPGYQVDFSRQIREQADIPTGAVGLITTAEQSEQILKKGRADFILYAREALRDPQLPLRAAQQLGADTRWPVQYLRGKEGM